MEFLREFRSISYELPGVKDIKPLCLFIGKGAMGIEIAVATSTRNPSINDLRSAWLKRLSGRATPLLLVVLVNDNASICGPESEEPSIYTDIEKDQIERICRIALEKPSRHSALRFLKSVLPYADTILLGIRNEGMLATRELSYGVRQRHDWNDVHRKAASITEKRSRDLILSLGFEISDTTGPVSILVAGQTKVAIAAFLDAEEIPDMKTNRFSGFSPVTYALSRGDRESLPYVIVTTDYSIRLYSVNPDVGTGRRGRTETYIEIQLDE